MEGVDQHVHQQSQKEQGHGQGQGALVVVQVRGAAQRGPGEHDPEQEQHDDGAYVDDDLHHRGELGRQEQVDPGHAGQYNDQVEGGVDDVLGRHHPDGGHGHGRGQEPEGDVLGDVEVGGGEQAGHWEVSSPTSWRPS